MRMLPLIKYVIALVCLMGCLSGMAFADVVPSVNDIAIDRIQLVTQQIHLLNGRLEQGKQELNDLQQAHDRSVSELTIAKASKSLLDKASLDISVTSSNLDSIKIELADSLQTVTWLEKNIQEIESQLNVLNIFGIKIARSEYINVQELHSDLTYQRQLLLLEKQRVKSLQSLQTIAKNTLSLKKDTYNRLSVMLKSQKMLNLKQQQMRDELGFQQQQNVWLQQLNTLYAQMAHIDPVKSRETYTELERSIFYANESANFAYFQSLIARYKDQMQQMRLAVTRGNSVGTLNELSDQVTMLSKQISRLEKVIQSRNEVLQQHIAYLQPRVDKVPALLVYVDRLNGMSTQYQGSIRVLEKLNKSMADFRMTLDKALQNELAQRQGILNVSPKMMLDLGKEMLLIPKLTFQVVKSLMVNLAHGVRSASIGSWVLFLMLEGLVLFTSVFIYKLLLMILDRPLAWRDQFSTKWLVLQWIKRHFVDLLVIGNMAGLLLFFSVPAQNYLFLVYLSFVWLITKSIMMLARLCLVEATHDAGGQDMRLYRRLRWFILIGGVITAITVFLHQLPLIYEVKAMCDWLFMLLMMFVSILLLRSWSVIPDLIISQIEVPQPYFIGSVKLICVLIPLLMLCNAVMGLAGFVNLITTVTWYEIVFLAVLVGYLILRGLLSDGMEQLSRLMITYVHNGWLWTEAFLKPLDNLLRISLFLSAWVLLFIFYGWDEQSPIVERLTGLMQYRVAKVFNTAITPLSIIKLLIVVSIFYWTAKWTREFVYRLLSSRTKDMGIRNSIAILSQYSVIVMGVLIALRVLGIDLLALTAVAGVFAVAMGFGLRDLANNFVCGFLILVERPLRVGDIVNINDVEGEVTHIGSRAVTIRTWDHMDLVVPNTDIYNKAFTNWTAKDNTVRTVVQIKISRYDNPHQVIGIIKDVLAARSEILKDPASEVYLKDMSDTLMEFEIRFYVNIRQVKSRVSVTSAVLMNVWDAFVKYDIKPPYPKQEIFLRHAEGMLPALDSVALPFQENSKL